MMLEQKELGNNEEFKDTELRRNIGWRIYSYSCSSRGSEHSLLISTDTYTLKFKKTKHGIKLRTPISGSCFSLSILEETRMTWVHSTVLNVVTSDIKRLKSKP